MNTMKKWTRENPETLHGQVQIPQKTIILSIHISESKVWSERKTMIVRQIKVGFGKSQLRSRKVNGPCIITSAQLFTLKLYFNFFLYLQAINLHNIPISIILDELFTRGQALHFIF